MSRWRTRRYPFGQILLFALLAFVFWWLAAQQHRFMRPQELPLPAVDLTALRTETHLYDASGRRVRSLTAQRLIHHRFAEEIEMVSVTYRSWAPDVEITAYAGAGYWSPKSQRLLLTDTVRMQQQQPGTAPLVLASEVLVLWPEAGEGEAPTPLWFYQGERWGRSDQMRAEANFTRLTFEGNATLYWPPAQPAIAPATPSTSVRQRNTPQ